MSCSLFRFEAQIRRVWCIGGAAMPLAEVAFVAGESETSLQQKLSHIPNLGFHTIRNAGLEVLIRTNSREGRKIGFLADGDVFEILILDDAVRTRMERDRARLLAWS